MQLLIILFILLSTCSCVVHATTDNEENPCPSSSCGNLSVTYPFKTQDSHPSNNCTYIDLHCDTNLNTPVVNLPYAGKFYIRYCTSHYEKLNPYIQLYDPENCIMRRLMSNLNFSFYAFMAIYYADYTFYACPKSPEQMIGDLISPIECLSNSTNILVALFTLTPDYELGYNCSVLGTWLLPVNDPLQYEMNANDDLYLTWNYTACLSCEDKDQIGIGNAWGSHSKSLYIFTTLVPLYVLFMIIY